MRCRPWIFLTRRASTSVLLPEFGTLTESTQHLRRERFSFNPTCSGRLVAAEVLDRERKVGTQGNDKMGPVTLRFFMCGCEHRIQFLGNLAKKELDRQGGKEAYPLMR